MKQNYHPTLKLVLCCSLVFVPLMLVVGCGEKLPPYDPNYKSSYEDVFEAVNSRNSGQGCSIKDVQFFVERGTDVNAKDDFGMPLFLHASHYCNVDVLKYLVSKGADLNAKDNQGETLINCAFYKAASYSNSIDVLKYLISKGADVNTKVPNGQTLINAALDGAVCNYRCNVDVLKYLISKGADVNAKDNFGKTPLINGIQGFSGSDNTFEIVKCLVENGADINKRDDGNVKVNSVGRTPLHYAAVHSTVEVLEYLISKGADINAIAGSSELNTEVTPLDEVTTEEKRTILLKAGAMKAKKQNKNNRFSASDEMQR